MRFIFWHHEIHGPVSLDEIWTGQHGFGGSVARLRILFWLAERGHEVYLIGNVKPAILRGVTALAGEDFLSSGMQHDSSTPPILVFNDAPSDEKWMKTAGIPNMIRIYSAGVHFPFKWLDRIRDGSLHGIVCVSRYHRDLYRIYRGFERVEYAYCGVDLDLIDKVVSSKFADPTVLSVSIPRRTKGFHNLLKAWKRVRAAVPNAQLRVCGSASMHDPHARLGKTGVLDEELEKEFPEFFSNPPQTCRQYGIELLGACTLESVYADIKGASVVAVNANWRGSVETYCRSAVEAQAAGVPVVGAKGGSLPEVVQDGVTGILVDSPNPNLLGDAIVKLLNNGALRQRMGSVAKGWARSQSDYSNLARDWEDIARRSQTGSPAPVERLQLNDFLRGLGWGQVRVWGKERMRHFGESK